MVTLCPNTDRSGNRLAMVQRHLRAMGITAEFEATKSIHEDVIHPILKQPARETLEVMLKFADREVTARSHREFELQGRDLAEAFQYA